MTFMLNSIAMKYCLFCLLLLAAGAPEATHASSDIERERQRALFNQGWSAAARGDRQRVREVIRELGDYVLVPYFQFELYRQRIDTVDPGQMVDFLARHRDWSFAPALEARWLRQLGADGRWELLLSHGGDSRDTRVRCLVARAGIETGRTEGVMDAAAELWVAPRSLPKECDPVFRWWRGNNGLTHELAWDRYVLAVQAGEIGLANYLRRYLADADRPWADRWVELARAPVAGFSAARQWPDHPHARSMLTYHLSAEAVRNWERADGAWRALEGRFAFSGDESARVTRQIALFRAVALDEGAIDAIDRLRERDQQILEWRLRAALARGDWAQVLASVEAMAPDEGNRSRWRYWRARALAALERPEAGLHFAALAVEPNYYGFLAADRLGEEYPLCTEELIPDDEIQRRLRHDAEVERALELFHVEQQWHARRTWLSALSRMGETELRQAALLAAANGWYERAIFALGDAGAARAYPWRFPMIERGRVEPNARRYQVDAGLIYGLMRAESAMQPDAVSPAGARGLLQLMPDTARAVARRNGLAYGGPGDLLDPAVNIPLGVAHLGELQARFDDNPLTVAAAYNAGIGAAERWRRERPRTDPDIWIETLPYFETRDYVSRVLAFATVYDWQLHGKPQSLAARMGMPETSAGRVEVTCE